MLRLGLAALLVVPVVAISLAAVDGDPRLGCALAEAAPAARGIEAPLDCARACVVQSRLGAVAARPRGARLRLRFRRGSRRVRVDLLRASRGGLALRPRRVASLGRRTRSFTARARALPDGLYVVRFRGRREGRRVAVRRAGGRFSRRPAFDRGRGCDGLSRFTLGSPAFGGRGRRPLAIAFRLAKPGRVGIVVRRRGKVVRRFRTRKRAPGRTFRLRLGAGRAGSHTVALTARFATRTVRSRLVSRALP